MREKFEAATAPIYNGGRAAGRLRMCRVPSLVVIERVRCWSGGSQLWRRSAWRAWASQQQGYDLHLAHITAIVSNGPPTCALVAFALTASRRGLGAVHEALIVR
jgi:hypothetical protein